MFYAGYACIHVYCGCICILFVDNHIFDVFVEAHLIIGKWNFTGISMEREESLSMKVWKILLYVSHIYIYKPYKN